MRPEHDRGRPGERAASSVKSGDTTMVPGADLACRVALLRVESERMRSTWLTAQLRDFADLLEVAEARGWFG